MSQPILFLLAPGFTDASAPGRTFFCPDCMLIEGLLRCYPHLRAQLDVRYVAFERPRAPVVALAGQAQQSLPLLVLPEASAAPQVTGAHQGRALVAGKAALIAYFTAVYGIDAAH